MDVWLRKDVAEAQAELVQKELQEPENVPPLAYFMKVMESLPKEGGTFLDTGCGCGHYGFLVDLHFPQWDYYGTDFSPAMIERAKSLVPLKNFRVCEFLDNKFAQYDAVLVSQVMEYAPDPWDWLDYAVINTRGYLILHRLRLIKGYSRIIEEPTYLGYPAKNYEWNYKQFLKHLSPDVLILPWADQRQYTIVVPPL